MSELDLLRRFVHAVVEVEGLPTAATYVPECDVALLRAGLSPEHRRMAAEWLLEAALQASSGAPRQTS